MRRSYFSWIGRVVGAVLPSTIGRIATREKVLYLTFDDGPTKTLTSTLLDLLDRYDAKATFFLLGAEVDRYPDVARDIVNRGHAIGNHTDTHIDPWVTGAAELIEELDKTNLVLRQLVDGPILFARPPYGHLTPGFVKWCKDNATKMVLWDVMPGDWWIESTADSVSSFVNRKVQPGSIVVLHDNDGPSVQAHSADAVEKILEYFTGAGWRFDALPV